MFTGIEFIAIIPLIFGGYQIGALLTEVLRLWI